MFFNREIVRKQEKARREGKERALRRMFSKIAYERNAKYLTARAKALIILAMETDQALHKLKWSQVKIKHDAITEWRQVTKRAGDDDFVFHGRDPSKSLDRVTIWRDLSKLCESVKGGVAAIRALSKALKVRVQNWMEAQKSLKKFFALLTNPSNNKNWCNTFFTSLGVRTKGDEVEFFSPRYQC